jgi:hypothetical protein
MKKIIYLSIIGFFLISPVFSKGYSFSIGGGYRLGYNYSYDYLEGFHQQITIPFIFSYYPGNSEIFSFGIRNKLGYGITINSKDKFFNSTNYDTKVSFNVYPLEHEIYDNISFIIEVGKNVKFVPGIGCAIKYSFVNIPDGSFIIEYSTYEDPKIDFFVLERGDYDYLSIGPTFDLNLEIINKTFCFTIGVPFEFLIPINNNLKKMEIKSQINSNYLYLTAKYANAFYLNFSCGIEFIFSFYSYKKI